MNETGRDFFGLRPEIAAAVWLAALTCGCGPAPHPRRPATDWSASVLMRPRAGSTSHPSSRPAVRVSAMQVLTLPARTYFYVRARVTYLDVEDATAEALTALGRAAEEGRVTFAGPPTFVYRGATQELDRPFELEVGYPVAEGARPFGRFRVRTLPPLHAATVVYSGPPWLIDAAYDHLIPAMEAAGLRPGDEIREEYLPHLPRDGADADIDAGTDAPEFQALVAIGLK